MNKQVGIVMVNFNGRNDTIECVKSLKEMDNQDFELIIVDNSPTPELEKDLSKDIVYLPNNKNLGLAIANDQGLKKSLDLNCTYTLFLNNDMTFEKDFLSKLIEAAKKYSTFGLITSKILYYGQRNVIWSAGLKDRLLLQPTSLGLNEEDGLQFNSEKEVFTGHCVVLFNNEVVKKIGLPYDDYFIMLEESEWGIRAHKHGFKNYYYPKSIAYHKVGRSMDTIADKGKVSVYYSIRNWLLTLRRDYSFFVFILGLLFHVFVLGSYYTILLAFKKKDNIPSYWNAVFDAMLNKTPNRYIKQ